MEQQRLFKTFTPGSISLALDSVHIPEMDNKSMWWVVCLITPAPTTIKYSSHQCCLNSQRGQISFCRFEDFTVVLPNSCSGLSLEHSLCHCIQSGLETQHPFIQSYGQLIQGVLWPGHKAVCSLASSADVGNVWSYTSVFTVQGSQ